MTRDREPFDSTEDAVALSFAKFHPDIRWCQIWGKWLIWSGAVWTRDQTVHVYDQIRESCRKSSEWVAESQLPDGFHMCSKVWEEITIPRFAEQARYGQKAGQANPRFLDADLFNELVLAPYREVFRDWTGPFIFEFQRTGMEPAEFLSRLDEFLGRLPADFSYAVEIRNVQLLGTRYHDLLRAHGVAHVYNHWTHMPPLADQHRCLGDTFPAPFVLFRLLTPLQVRYQEAVERAEPYDHIVEVLTEMRADTQRLLQQAVQENRRAYVLVNNRAEGCAPLTVQALVDRLFPERHPPGDP